MISPVKRVLVVGCVLVVVMCLFPPYYGTRLLEGDNIYRFVGYHFIASPPSIEAMYEAFVGWPIESRAP